VNVRRAAVGSPECDNPIRRSESGAVKLIKYAYQGSFRVPCDSLNLFCQALKVPATNGLAGRTSGPCPAGWRPERPRRFRPVHREDDARRWYR
jgi:hypothetical protein